MKEKGTTTYNEVADELVAEETELKRKEWLEGGDGAASVQNRMDRGVPIVDEKNIRRRVYDSLNVLMAMEIIKKEKKLISWQGFSVARCSQAEDKIAQLQRSIAEKKRVIAEKNEQLRLLSEQTTKTNGLVERNKYSVDVQDILNSVTPRLPVHRFHEDRIGLPFVLIQTKADTAIQMEVNDERNQVSFSFDSEFAIMDDREVLKKMSIDPPRPLLEMEDFMNVDQFTSHLPTDHLPANMM